MAQPWVYVAILLIGIFLKFYKIDFRFFWYDEVYTIVQTSGLSFKEYNEKLSDSIDVQTVYEKIKEII